MIVFQVMVNGKEACRAGVKDLGVVSAILTRVRRIPTGGVDPNDIEDQLTFDVGGIDSTDQEHVAWLGTSLHAGDTVSIRIIEADRADDPRERRREDPEAVAKAQRQYYERLKKEYGE